MCAWLLGYVPFFAAPWTVAHQTLLPMGFPRQEYWLAWVPFFLTPGISLTQGSNPHLLHLLYWQEDSLPLVPPGQPCGYVGRVLFQTEWKQRTNCFSSRTAWVCVCTCTCTHMHATNHKQCAFLQLKNKSCDLGHMRTYGDQSLKAPLVAFQHLDILCSSWRIDVWCGLFHMQWLPSVSCLC